MRDFVAVQAGATLPVQITHRSLDLLGGWDLPLTQTIRLPPRPHANWYDLCESMVLHDFHRPLSLSLTREE